MKLAIAGQELQNTKTLRLVYNEDNEIVIADEKGWSIITFRVNEDDQLVLVRNTDIEDEYIATDDDGCILEEDE